MKIFNGPMPAPVAENAKFWNFINLGDKKAELSIYGDISSYESWWGDGTEVTPNNFKKELENLGSVDEILVRINSGGGDVFAGHAIRNMLKNNTARIVVRVEGLAASAASVIATAGDEVIVGPTDYYMIHNPSTIAWGDAKDLRKTAETLDVIKEGIINAYVDKTGKTTEEISVLMDAETWMTGVKAVEMGFADKTGQEDEEHKNVVLNSNKLVLNGVSIDISSYKNFPRAAFENKTATPKNEEKGENNVEITNLDELKKAHPDLCNQLITEAKKEATNEERTRIQNIESISETLDPTLVNKAKYESPVDAKELAFQAVRADAKKGAKYKNDVAADTETSGVTTVTPDPEKETVDKAVDTKKAEDDAAKEIAEIANKSRR